MIHNEDFVRVLLRFFCKTKNGPVQIEADLISVYYTALKTLAWYENLAHSLGSYTRV